MPANFSVQFIVNEKTQTRVLKLTDTSTGFTLAKGNFSITFPDGSTRIKTDFTSPDINTVGGNISIPAVTDNSNNVLTGAYKVDFAALDASSTAYTASISFDFNWVKPSNGITNLTDVLIPEVKFQDTASYSPIGSFTGTLSRTLACSFPATSEASAAAPISTVSSSTIDIVNSGKYYDGTYNPTSDVTVDYTHSSESRLTIQYVELFTKTFLIKRCPTQVELVVKINNYRALIDAYKGNNDTQFNLLSEQYDLVIALYSHLITRYETSTQDGSEPVLRELLSILEPYATSYTPQLTRMLPFEIASTGTNSFNVSDGTNTDSIPLGSTLLLSSGNPAFTINVANNIVTYTPTFGSTSNTFAQGNDTRFHNAVTIGTANGLSLASQVLSLALATTSTSGAFSASDKAKLDGIAAGANTGTVTSVAVSVPSAFSVSGSPITTNGTINISATGNPLQYITGAGALATLNTGAVPENGSLYFTNARARAAISVTGSLSYNSTTGVISYTTPSETDPVFTASAAYGISSTNISNWNTAYGWGNHASAGYLTSINSSQVTTALGYTPENAANKGVANGYASLDGAGLVPSTQLPSYVDDVLEYADLASLPATGTTGKIYVTLDTNKIYRWSGTIYVEISSSAGGGGTWGSITGTLSNQTDLQAALDAKQNSLGFTPVTNARTLTINGVTYDLTANRTWTVSGTLAAGGTAGQILSKVDSTDYNTAWIDNFASQLKHDVKLGATLAKGKAVYVSSADGTNMIVSAASNASEATSSKTLGLLETGGVTNDPVKVITEGLLTGLDTSTATAGDPVWLGTNGDLIFGLANKPVAPAHLVFIGIVTRVQSNNGEIFVKVQNGFELQELHNVLISSVANNQGLFYESSTGLWKNKTIATVLGYTPVDASLTTNYIPKATGATTLGNSNIQDNGTSVSIGGSGNVNINNFIGGSFSRVLPTGNTYAGQSFNITGSADGWSLVNRNTWNINDDAFTTNGFAINDNRLILTRSATAANGWQNYQSLVQNNGTASQSATGIISQSSGSGNFGSFVGYRVGASGNPANANSYTEYVGFKMQYTPQNVTNYYGISINDFTGTSLSRGVELNLASGTGKWNIYASGTANNYMAGSLGIGSTSLTGINLNVTKQLTGGTVVYGIAQQGQVQSDVTGSATGYYNSYSTQATAFTLANYYHYFAQQSTIGAGSTVTNQAGFFAQSNLTGATNNYGFRGAIPSGTGRWNIYMDGTANNYLAGSLGIGTTTLTTQTLNISKNITGGVSASGVIQNGYIQSDVTTSAFGFSNQSNTATATFTLGNYYHYNAQQGTFGSGSTVTSQYGFITTNLTGATNNYGFYGGIPVGTGRWNLYMTGTAQNYLAGDVGIGVTVNNASAKLQVDSTTEGFLPPRMTAAQRAAISSPADGLIVFQTDGTIGLYVYASAAWHALTML